MFPKYHIIFGAIFSLLIYLIFPITISNVIIIFLSSFLIDFDHYLLYVFKTKDFSLKRATEYFSKRRKKWLRMPLKEREEYKRPVFLFHGIECWLILVILSFFEGIFLYILIGIAIHMFLDYLDILINKEPFYCKFSQMYVWLRNKGKEIF